MRIQLLGGMPLPLIFAAISVNNYSFSTIAPLIIIGILSGIYAFVLNDYYDVEVDKLSKDLSNRALVKGTISKKTAIIIAISCFTGAYLTVFLFFFKIHNLFFIGLGCLIVADALGFIYNRYGKQIIASDFLVALAQSLYFLFAALIVIQSGNLGIFTWILFILIFTQLLYMNAIAGGLKDADHDYLRNVKNIALASGVKVTRDKRVFIPQSFKIFGIGLRILTATFIFVPFIFFGISYEPWQPILLIFFVILLFYTGISMLTIKTFDRKKIRQLIMTQFFTWYCIVPIILVSLIAPVYALLLIVIPFVWYIFISHFMGEKVLEPQV